MIGVGAAVVVALVWSGVVFAAVAGCAVIERRSRLAGLRDRRFWRPSRSRWGSDPVMPPVSSIVLRTLSGAARLVRSRTVVVDQSATLRLVGRGLSWIALASALSLVPFAGAWGGEPTGLPLVVVDLQNGLLALVFFVLLMGLSQVALGLADHSVWSRLGSVRMAGRHLAALGLLILVLAPLSIGTGSFRLYDIVSAQQATFAPLAWLPSAPGVPGLEVARAWHWPNWNLFVQPLSALLFIPALVGLTHRPWAREPVAGSLRPSGFGLDADPAELYRGRLEARLARVLAAALFVALFLGAGSIPFVSGVTIVDRLEPFAGRALPALLVAGFETGVFFGKLMILLVFAAAIRRTMARLRDDRWIAVVTMRLIPVAWANALLVSAIFLLRDAIQGGS